MKIRHDNKEHSNKTLCHKIRIPNNNCTTTGYIKAPTNTVCIVCALISGSADTQALVVSCGQTQLGAVAILGLTCIRICPLKQNIYILYHFHK